MTKEEIGLWSDLLHRFITGQEATNQYAKARSITFLKWAEINAVKNGEDTWKYKGDDGRFLLTVSTDQLYNLFIEASI